MSMFLRTRVVHVDWWRIVTDLMAKGLSQREIGHRCNVDQSSINKLRNNTHCQPLYGTGVRLLALWLDVCDKDVSQVPEVDTQR